MIKIHYHYEKNLSHQVTSSSYYLIYKMTTYRTRIKYIKIIRSSISHKF